MRFLFFSLSRLNFIAQLQLQDGKVDNDNARGEKKRREDERESQNDWNSEEQHKDINGAEE